MARPKRSQKQAEQRELPQPRAPVVTPTATQVLAALCPVCGRAIPEKRAIKIGHVTVDNVRYFSSIEWQTEKQFGVRFQAAGRESFKNWQYISPEDAPELFHAMHQRFVDSIKEWRKKNWLSDEDIADTQP